MALSREDKKDVSGAMGKALANKVSKVTNDREHKAWLKGGSTWQKEISKTTRSIDRADAKKRASSGLPKVPVQGKDY